MSYQVLARKYRPASFEELEGQEHVLRALVNALENDRLHHAYLFTGTRGVGKTTIARILARCLNCERGITAKPCGECGTCLEIAEGRSVDLIEVDAASRTKVEDTRELLDNVQYMPSHNRFKVYLIDEVHMLSTHSFNALLKTLEEPPEHVKFLLATTDPKKLPVTVLSRCLQFNLKNLSPERIVNYLQKILPVEGIEFDEPALWLLGRAADGSMRDALSLTDQAISFGNNAVLETDVKLMLGSIDQKEVYDLIDGLIRQDAKSIVEKISQLAEHAPDYSGLLSELLAVLHRVAMAQAVPDGIDNSQGDKELVLSVANALTPEDVQLFYQIGLVGQRDLPYAPNLRTGFEMIMLRMLAFTPFADAEGNENHGNQSHTPQKKTVEFEKSGTSEVSELLSSLRDAPQTASQASLETAQLTASEPRSAATSLTKPQIPQASSAVRGQVVQTAPDEDEDEDEFIDFGDPKPAVAKPPVDVVPKIAPKVVPKNVSKAVSKIAMVSQAKPDSQTTPDTNPVAQVKEALSESQPEQLKQEQPKQEQSKQEQPKQEQPKKDQPEQERNEKVAQVAPNVEAIKLSPETWVDVLPLLGLSGVTLSVASNCSLIPVNEKDACKLVLSESQASLWNKNHEVRIQAALTKYYGRECRLDFEVGTVVGETPAQIQAVRREAARVAAVELIEADVKVRRLIESFDGTLDKDTITARQ
jgi:DNA polymerase-3 subunit gamma/tau